MKVVFFILLGFLALMALILLPIRAKAYFVLDYKTKSLCFSLRAWKFNLSCGKIFVLDDYQIVTDTKSSGIMKLQQPKLETYYFVKKLFSLLTIKQFIFLLEFGLNDDAFGSAMVVASLQAIIFGLISGSEKKFSSYAIKFKQVVSETQLNVTASTALHVNILQILIAVIYSKIIYKKQKGEKKQYAKAN